MATIPFIFNLGSWEVVVILFVILLLFGGKKIPELARGLGKGIKEFNDAKNNIENEIKQGMREGERKNLDDDKH